MLTNDTTRNGANTGAFARSTLNGDQSKALLENSKSGIVNMGRCSFQKQNQVWSIREFQNLLFKKGQLQASIINHRTTSFRALLQIYQAIRENEDAEAVKKFGLEFGNNFLAKVGDRALALSCILRVHSCVWLYVGNAAFWLSYVAEAYLHVWKEKRVPVAADDPVAEGPGNLPHICPGICLA